MTVQEAQETVRQFQKIFVAVRVVDPEGFRVLEFKEGKEMECPFRCYDFWKRGTHCENCISSQVSAEIPQKTKLEIVGSDVYQIIARYVEIEGKQYVMEMINCLDHDSPLDTGGRRALFKEISRLDSCNESRKKKSGRILIVDDSGMNRAILCEMLGSEFEILEAESGEKGLELLEQYGSGISLMLLDINMPGMSGFEVLNAMKEKPYADEIPVMMISSEEAAASIRQAYEMGAVDYINRPFDAQIVHRRVNNTIKLYEKQRRLTATVEDLVYEKEKNNQMMISILSQIVEFRNGESGLHVKHINIITGLLLERLIQKTKKYDLSWNDCQTIVTASSLHDIGKIGINDKILNKPGKLTQEEYEVIKTHTLIGAGMLREMKIYQDEPLMKVGYEICRWHHERYDGNGYPDGLKGEEIPISAQVVGIADAYDALISERVYKKAFSHETAVAMIKNGECGAFHPLLLECLEEVQDKIFFSIEHGCEA